MKPRLLDLFCGAGGAAMGYHRAGFEVVGVDIAPQPRFPFEFVQADALEFLRIADGASDVWDAIHASPPCQAYSRTWVRWKREHDELIVPTRQGILETGLPYVIENVEGARSHLIDPVRICGGSLGLRYENYYLSRHRLFECSFTLMVPPCVHDGVQALGVYGNGGTSAKQRGRSATRAMAAAGMEIDWMTKAELNQAIPPAYTELIGYQLRAEVEAAAKVPA